MPPGRHCHDVPAAKEALAAVTRMRTERAQLARGVRGLVPPGDTAGYGAVGQGQQAWSTAPAGRYAGLNAANMIAAMRSSISSRGSLTSTVSR